MAEEVVKTIENVDKLFSEIVVNGEVHKSNRYVSPSAQSASPSSVRSTQGEDVHAVELNDVLHNFSDPDVVSDVQTLQQGLTNETNARYNADQNLQGQIDTVGGNVSTLQGKVSTIESEIPPQASSSNQLADKNFVNSSISTNTANFLGTYTSMADIEAIQNPTNNDYVFLQTTDSAGNNVFSRYKYNADQGEWLYEYELNNSSFTAEQWATINSGLTQSSVTQEIEDAIGQYVYNSFLPTDAVLHYSFDEVPDYPDGSADVRYTNGNTYNIPVVANGTMTTDPYVEGDGKVHKSNINGNANYKMQALPSITSIGVYLNVVDYVGKIFILEIDSKTDKLKPAINYRVSGGNQITIYPWGTVPLGKSKLIYLLPSDWTSCAVTLYARVAGEVVEFEILNYYIGNGSYSTPVIDNANGQNNGTNYGGIAVQGLSGKGMKFFSGKYVSAGASFQLTPNFTVSVWVNPENNTLNLNGDIVAKYNQLILRNGAGASWGNFLMLYLYGENETLINGVGIQASLLTPNTWTHIVVTRDGLNCYAYINGVKVKTFTLANSTLRQTTAPFTLCGTDTVINGRNQSVDDLLIFNRALSEEEVFALYQNKANTPKYYDINNYKWNDVSFLTITTAEYSSTYNVLTIAEDMLKENKFRIKYVSVADNSAYKAGAPYYFTVYEIRQKNDTVVVNATSYQNGNVITNGRSRSGSWTGWKEIPSIIPPSTNGTYNLQCTVANGVSTYSWVSV